MSARREWDESDNGSWSSPYGYGGFYNMGPVSIPPKVPYVGMTDTVSGAVKYLSWTGSGAIVLSATIPSQLNVTIYKAHDGPYLPLSIRLDLTSGVLVGVDVFPEVNQSGYAFIFNSTNPFQQTWPEPTNIPTQPPPLVPGIPSTSPVPTGGGYAAFVANAPHNLPTFVTVILTKGGVKNVAFFNGTQFVTPAGVPLVGIM